LLKREHPILKVGNVPSHLMVLCGGLSVAPKLRFEFRVWVWMLVVLAAGALSILPASAAGFSGQFDGIGAAVGMKLTLEEVEGRVVGRFSSGRGDPFSLNGRRTGEAAQGSVVRAGQQFFFHLEIRPLGVQFLLIPRTPEGAPDISGGTDYSFVQQGLQVPRPSAYRAAPPRGIQVDIVDFIDAFRNWQPADMARIYGALDNRYKELLQLFDHAAAEVLWRVCATKPPNASFSSEELARLLERQHVSCESYLSAVASVRDAGLMSEFLRKANFQLELIRETVKCDRGQSPETKCADVGAMSGPLMLRWRRAGDIMSLLVGDTGPVESSDPVPAAQLPLVPGPRSIQPGVQPELASSPSSVPLPKARPGIPPQPSAGAGQPQLPVPRERPGVRLRH